MVLKTRIRFLMILVAPGCNIQTGEKSHSCPWSGSSPGVSIGDFSHFDKFNDGEGGLIGSYG